MASTVLEKVVIGTGVELFKMLSCSTLYFGCRGIGAAAAENCMILLLLVLQLFVYLRNLFLANNFKTDTLVYSIIALRIIRYTKKSNSCRSIL